MNQPDAPLHSPVTLASDGRAPDGSPTQSNALLQRRALLAAAGGLAAGVALARSASAGPLNPPAGPVTSTGKTLVEVEPRIAINSTNTPGNAGAAFRITQPGSYYLTGNLTGEPGKHGIQIDSHGVTLDLNGFALFGVTGSLDGIHMPSFRENIVIRNGLIAAWPGSGLSTRMDIGRIEHISANGNGAWGIDNHSGTFTSHIHSCESLGNGSVAAGTGGIRGGANSQISDCVANSNTGTGIMVASSSLVTDCVSRSNTGVGIHVGNQSLVKENTSNFNGADGILVSSGCLVVGNLTGNNGSTDGAGIHATGTDNRIDGNLCTGADRGIDVDSAGNIIVRNTCSGNAVNWDVLTGNVILVVSAVFAGTVNGNAGGVAPGSTDPNANFTF